MSRQAIVFSLLFVSFFSLGFGSARAEVLINEIMYDVEDTDTGREWIEVYNNSDTAVDLSAFKFFEAETDHGIVPADGGTEVEANSYAVIALDPVKFKIDWPDFSGIIFDSSFSLSNEGETLAIKDSDLNIVDEYTYNSATGAQGDLRSLQKISGVWQSALPTPGGANQASADIPSENPDSGEENEENISTESSSSSGSSSSKKSANPTPKKSLEIKAQIAVPSLVSTGIPFWFQGTAFGHEGEQLFRGRYFWNFGDGSFREVEVVGIDKFNHTFFYPGEYSVILEYYPDFFTDVPSASQRMTIKAASPEISISRVGDEKDFFVELANNTGYDVDLSRWIIMSDFKSFAIPRNTIVGPKKKIIISSRITNFSIQDKNSLRLMTSQYEPAFSYSPSSNLNRNLATAPVLTSKQPIQTAAAAESSVSTEDLTAVALSSDLASGDLGDDNPYFSPVALAFLVATGGGAVYLVRQKKKPSQSSVSGDDFELLE